MVKEWEEGSLREEKTKPEKHEVEIFDGNQ